MLMWQVVSFILGVIVSYLLSEPGLARIDRARRKVSWRAFGATVRRSVVRVASSDFQPQVIIGLNSGIVPASIIALNLRVADLYFFEALPLYENGVRKQTEFRDIPNLDVSGKRVLIVDDQAYTGRSLDAMVLYLEGKGAQRELIQTHVLYEFRGGAGGASVSLPAIHSVQGKVKRMPWVILDGMMAYWSARETRRSRGGD